jgi:hypothetical protein
MTDPRGNVRPGQRLALAAEQVNWINRQMKGGGGFTGGGLEGWQPGTNLVLCKNATGSDVARWGVMEITGVEINPNTDAYAENSFGEMPCVTGGTVTGSSGKALVAIEPIKAGKVGRVAVSGYVQIKAADIPKVGGAVELWRDDQWALIRFGGGGIRLGTIAASWSKGATATVTQQKGDGSAMTGNPTFTATNYFAAVTVTTGTKRVACALVDSTWILIAAEC